MQVLKPVNYFEEGMHKSLNMVDCQPVIIPYWQISTVELKTYLLHICYIIS